jgi:hypothetical protein
LLRCWLQQCISKRQRKSLIFLLFSENVDQRNLWINAISQCNEDGSLWQPKVHTQVCSLHFVTGKQNQRQNHPDYSPSIFTTGDRAQRSISDYRCHERLLKRHKQEQSSRGKIMFSNFKAVLPLITFIFTILITDYHEKPKVFLSLCLHQLESSCVDFIFSSSVGKTTNEKSTMAPIPITTYSNSGSQTVHLEKYKFRN